MMVVTITALLCWGPKPKPVNTDVNQDAAQKAQQGVAELL
jgi:hypothetical protein